MADTKNIGSLMSEFAFPLGSLVDPSPYNSLLCEWHGELMTHYVGRFQCYAALPMKLAGCSSADDVAEVQSAFYRRLVSDYQSTAEKLSEIPSSRIESSETADVAEYSAKILKAQADARKIIELAKQQAERIIESAEKTANASKKETAAMASKAA